MWPAPSLCWFLKFPCCGTVTSQTRLSLHLEPLQIQTQPASPQIKPEPVWFLLAWQTALLGEPASPGSRTRPRYESGLFLFSRFSLFLCLQLVCGFREMCVVGAYLGVCCALGRSEGRPHPSLFRSEARWIFRICCGFFSYFIFCLNFFH